jgi:hypothetical protein
MSSINLKISPTKKEYVQDNSLNWSSYGYFENSGLKSAFSPVFNGSGNFRHSKLGHNSLSSSSVSHFSEGKNLDSTPALRKLMKELITPFSLPGHIIDSKETVLQPIHTLTPPTSELMKVQKMNVSKTTNKDNKCETTRLFRKDEYNHLKNNECTTYTGKAQRTKGKTKNILQQVRGRIFICKYCSMSFNKAQSLGGHVSRTHPGESREYKQKKIIRKSRELERAKLFLAKRKFFQSIDYDYDDLLRTPEGKMKARALLNRARIKNLKKGLTKEELDEFLEERLIDDISN